jgi:signal transduction histidine kinase
LERPGSPINVQQRSDDNVLWVLGIGFAVTIGLMLISAFRGIEAVQRVDARRASFEQEYRASTRLIDEIQGEEAGLSGIFYSLAQNPGPEERKALLAKLDAIEQRVEPSLADSLRPEDREQWLQVKEAADRFGEEVRRALTSPSRSAEPSAELYRRHAVLLAQLGEMVSSNYEDAIRAQPVEFERTREQLREAGILLGAALLLSVLCAIFTIRIAARTFRHIRWQASELARLSHHVFESQETVVRRLSRELHDEFGQTLSAIEANLASIQTRAPDISHRLEDCMLLVKDAMGNVRELAQLLRPSILDDFGLVAGLQWLADSFTQRSGIPVKLRIGYDKRLAEETETHLFRIAQEALTNVARHSGATEVEIVLQLGANSVVLSIADNGHGFGPKGGAGGFGLMGMRERVRSVGGELTIRNTPQGVTLTVEAPLRMDGTHEKDPSLISG